MPKNDISHAFIMNKNNSYKENISKKRGNLINGQK